MDGDPRTFKLEDNTWLLSVQMAIFLVGCIFLYGFMYWQSGGRESFYESKEVKEARWNQIFDVGGPEVNIPGAPRCATPDLAVDRLGVQAHRCPRRLGRGEPAECAGPEVRQGAEDAAPRAGDRPQLLRAR